MFRTFLVGAIGYPCLELLYRRRTHYSMALAGGISTCLLSSLRNTQNNLLVKSVLGGCGITGVEFLVGQIWNKHHEVWDYSKMPMNIQGQVCLPYSLLWCFLSAGAFVCMNNHES